MGLIVQKYGGSSLADIEKLKKVAEMIASVKKNGYNVVAVVSAMGKTTNSLISLAKEISPNPEKREMDMLLSTGERTTMALICIALNELGVEAISLTGSQAGIITNDRHNDARVIEVRPVRVQDELEKGKVVVIGGFQGVSYKRDITTLGRGGSDTSAVALAAALSAERCEVYSDVDGVYSADPNLIPDAEHLPEISYQQIQEMAEAGAKVLNAQAVQFVKDSKIAVYARSTFQSGKETVIREDSHSIKSRVIAVVYEKDIIRILHKPNDSKQLGEILKFFFDKDIPLKELSFVQESDEFSKNSFIISKSNIHNWDQVRSELGKSFPKNLIIDESLATVSLIGEGFSSDNKIVIESMTILSDNRIEYFGLTTTSFRLSLLIKKGEIENTVRLLHEYWISK
ncbi:MAG: aspartate kinase [Ignavibacteria bacterium]|jgi:aspartate kinase